MLEHKVKRFAMQTKRPLDRKGTLGGTNGHLRSDNVKLLRFRQRPHLVKQE